MSARNYKVEPANFYEYKTVFSDHTSSWIHYIFKNCSVTSNKEKKLINLDKPSIELVAINIYDQNSVIVNFGRESKSK